MQMDAPIRRPAGMRYASMFLSVSSPKEHLGRVVALNGEGRSKDRFADWVCGMSNRRRSLTDRSSPLILLAGYVFRSALVCKTARAGFKGLDHRLNSVTKASRTALIRGVCRISL
jgi:hypothetical protein